MSEVTRLVAELKNNVLSLDVENEYRRYGRPNVLVAQINKAEKIVLQLKEAVKLNGC